MAITVRDDYKGFFKIFQDVNKDALDEYITRYEQSYLIRLLGCDLYEEFIADLTPDSPQTPQTQRFIDIFDPFCDDERTSIGNYVRVEGYSIFPDDDCCLDCPRRYMSRGIPDMLKGFVRWHFLRDQSTKNTQVGFSTHNSDTFTTVSDSVLSDRLATVWNEAVESFNAISYRICDNLGDYPNYKGDGFILPQTNYGF